MLYNKNNDDNLSLELFQNPTSEYRGTPFWAWNCKLDKDELLRQIEIFKKMGFGGVHIHSRSGMSSQYLGKEFMDLVKQCEKKAERESMLLWLYDEDRWPSGYGGGFVTKTKKHRKKYLTFTMSIPENYYSFSETKESNLFPALLACYDVVLNNSNEIDSYKRIGIHENAKGEKWYALLNIAAVNDPRYNNQNYVDTLSSEATDNFIQITYEAYKKCIGEKFGKTVPAIFTDEPQFQEKGVFPFADSKNNIIIPWTTDFSDTYKAIYKKDILDFLPELFWELPCGAVSQIRYWYHDHVCERFTKAFVDRCGAWCKNNNIMLTGHMKFEPTLWTQTYHIGEAMRAYRAFDLPGIDILCDWIELTTAKQAQSASRQYGCPGVLSELYGVTGYDFDFRGYKFQGDWQAALGVTVRVPHLSLVTMKGSAKRDFPGSINYQTPWHERFSYVEDHYARLNTALTRGKAVVNVGVIHPIESYWMHYGPNDVTSPIRQQMEDNFSNITNWLLFGLIDFDYISESLLPNQVNSISNKLSLGAMSYSTIVVPCCETLRRTTFEALKNFKSKGGNLIFVGICPKYIDASPTEEIKELYDSSVVIMNDKNSLLNALKDERVIDIKTTTGKRTDNLLYTLKEDGDSKWLFVAHGKKYNGYDNHLDFLESLSRQHTGIQNISICVHGCYKPLRYDTLSGNISNLSYETKNDKTYFNYTLFEHDSLLLKLVPTKEDKLQIIEPKYEVIDTIDFREKVDYSLSEPNVYLLDTAEHALDNSLFEKEEELLKIDQSYRRILNFPDATGNSIQPWAIETENTEHHLNLRFKFDSEIEIENCFLGVEEAEHIELNNKVVPIKQDGYYVDQLIRKIPLSKIVKGTNVLTVKIPFTARLSAEYCYLIGNFNVRVEGVKKTITEPTNQIGFSSIVNQGMPFYGGNITYKVIINTPDCTLKIRTSDYKGAAVSVKIDGSEVGVIAYEPYILTVHNIKSGNHIIEFVLNGNRFNTFGSMHNSNKYDTYYWPNHWYTTGSNWCYEYKTKDIGILSSPVIEICKSN